MNMSKALLQLNFPRSIITLPGTEKLKDSPTLQVMSLRIPGLGAAWQEKKTRLDASTIFIYGSYFYIKL